MIQNRGKSTDSAFDVKTSSQIIY